MHNVSSLAQPEEEEREQRVFKDVRAAPFQAQGGAWVPGGETVSELHVHSCRVFLTGPPLPWEALLTYQT